MWLFVAMLMVVLTHLMTIAVVMIGAAAAGGAALWVTRPESEQISQADPAEFDADAEAELDEPVLVHSSIRMPRQYGERTPSDGDRISTR